MRGHALGFAFGGALVLGLTAGACGGKLDPDATGDVGSRGTGTTSSSGGGASSSSSSSSGGSTSSSSSSSSSGGAQGCSMKTPIREDFEEGLPTDWGAAPAGLQFDSIAPISGSRSLKIDLAKNFGATFLQRSFDATCGLTMKLAVRFAAPLFKGKESVTIVRLVSQPAFFDLVIGAGGTVTLVEETGTEQGITQLGTLEAGIATGISLTLDLKTKTFSSTFGDSKVVTGAIVTGSKELRGIFLGQRVSTASNGVYWLDDFSLE